MNKDRDDFNAEKNEINIDSTKEMSNNSNNLNAKQIIDDMIAHGFENDDNVEKLANTVNKINNRRKNK